MNLRRNSFRRAAIVALFLLVTQVYSQNFDIRALWIVRDHITSKDKINAILEFAKKNNYNNLFVQVRGRGDAYYTSRLVPRSHLLLKNSFDPLDYILKESKKYNLKIHAWLNVYYLWSSSNLPVQQDHLIRTHPSWLDSNKPDPINVPVVLNKMKLDRKFNGEGFYLSPTHPEVDAHLQNIITEIVQNYSLDGIHFDYIRYHDLGWGMNPTGLKFFLNYSGNIPGIPALQIQEKPSFAEFKRSAITAFLSKASTRIRAYQPNCVISAAVKPNLNNARNTFGQEWDVWLAGGYIDWAVPMNYTSNEKIFNKNIKIMKENLPERYHDRIIMGIGVYNQDASSSGRKIYQVAKNKFSGISIFSYTVFKEKPNYANKLVNYLK